MQVDREARSIRISPGFRSGIFDGSLISTPHFLASSRNWATLDEYHPSFPTKSSISCIKFTNPASSPVDATHSKAQSGRTGVTPHPDSGTDSRENTHKRIVEVPGAGVSTSLGLDNRDRTTSTNSETLMTTPDLSLSSETPWQLEKIINAVASLGLTTCNFRASVRP